MHWASIRVSGIDDQLTQTSNIFSVKVSVVSFTIPGHDTSFPRIECHGAI